MTVNILGYGSIWEEKRSGPKGGAYFNTTGLPSPVTDRFVRKTLVSGKVRFNTASGFRLTRKEEFLNHVFECDPLGTDATGNSRQLLVKRHLPKAETPDAFLFCLDSARWGRLDWTSEFTLGGDAQVVAASGNRLRQQTLVLLTEVSWVLTDQGRIVVRRSHHQFWSAELFLLPRP